MTVDLVNFCKIKIQAAETALKLLELKQSGTFFQFLHYKCKE